jgi:GT2 family glycosyltransferase
VVIVNWNAGEHLVACLESVRRAAGGLAVETILVDNASADDSVALARASGLADRILQNEDNLGFSVANNRGARLARGRYLLFLNPDTVISDGALPALVGALERDPRLGVVAPRLTDEDGRPSRDMGHRLPTPLTVASSFLLLSRLAPRLFPGITRETDVSGLERCGWVCGAATLMRREVWERVPWNEQIFINGEDIDLGSRVRDAGWEIAVTGDAEVRHLAGRSFAKHTNPRALADSPSGIVLHLRRHSSPLGVRVGLAAMLLGLSLRWAGHTALYRLTGDPARLRKARKLRLFIEQDRARGAEGGAPRAGGERSP